MEKKYLFGIAGASVVLLVVTWYFIPAVAYLFGAYLLFYFTFQVWTGTKRSQRIRTYDLVHTTEFTPEQLQH